MAIEFRSELASFVHKPKSVHAPCSFVEKYGTGHLRWGNWGLIISTVHYCVGYQALLLAEECKRPQAELNITIPRVVIRKP